MCIRDRIDTEVELIVEIRAHNPDGFPDEMTRTVMENAKTLKFERNDLD